MAPPLHPPAWYPDPEHPDRIRRWNGRAWTEDVRPRPAWLRTVRLAPGPPARVPKTSRRLWGMSLALLATGGLVMFLLSRGAVTDLDRIADRDFTAAADALCAETEDVLPDRSQPGTTAANVRTIEARTVTWERMVDDLRQLPVAGSDTAAVDRWLGEWERWTALRHDYVDALQAGDDAEATRLLEQAQTPHAALTRVAIVNGMNGCVFR